jgi:Ca-activated chloride channel homolog
VLSRPATVQIGIVSFSGSGFTVQPPTYDVDTLLGTIGRLQPTSGTSLGQGILSALNTIAVDAGLAPAATPTPSTGQQQPGQSDEQMLAQLPEGVYPPSVIVLLSDGENNQSIDPLKTAQAAADRGVRIDAIGFGTTAGIDLKVDGYIVHTSMDEEALTAITAASGGAYYPGEGEQDRKEVYANLTPKLVVKAETMEITALFAGASIVMLLAGSLLSMLWFNRLP